MTQASNNAAQGNNTAQGSDTAQGLVPEKKPITKTIEGSVYEVFARFRDEEMHHIGSIVALSEELAEIYASDVYDEWRWDEMKLIARENIVSVIPIK